MSNRSNMESDTASSFPWLAFDDSPDGSGESAEQIEESRVCDRCIQKKLKCKLDRLPRTGFRLTAPGDQKRPMCSRCINVGHVCTYTTKRKRPGPAKGSKRRFGAETISGTETPDLASQRSHDSGNYQGLPQSSLVSRSHHAIGIGSQGVLNALQEREWLTAFVTRINPTTCLFLEEVLKQQHELDLVGQPLLLTIYTVSLTLLDEIPTSQTEVVGTVLRALLHNNVLEDSNGNPTLLLQQFQQACLLVYYEFLSQPGPKTWMKIGALTRKAYQYGLHQIDDDSVSTPFFLPSADGITKEQWRLIWWFIYRLDTWSNLFTLSPFVIEQAGIGTALPSASNLISLGADPPNSHVKLSEELVRFPDVIGQILSREFPNHDSISIVMLTLQRESATIPRLARTALSGRLRERSDNLYDTVRTVRQQVTAFHSQRDVSGETSAQCQRRLFTLLGCHAVVALSLCSLMLAADASEHTHHYRQAVLRSQDIAIVIAQLEEQPDLVVHPLLSLVVCGTLWTLGLLGRIQFSGSAEFDDTWVGHNEILTRFIQNFTPRWNLPRIMLASVQLYLQSLPDSMSFVELVGVLKSNKPPLHLTTLRTLSSLANTLPVVSPSTAEVPPGIFWPNDEEATPLPTFDTGRPSDEEENPRSPSTIMRQVWRYG